MTTAGSARRRPRIDWVVLDVGETLIDETGGWARWAH